MKKTLITLSIAASLATVAFAGEAEMQNQLNSLSKQNEEMAKQIKKLQKEQKKAKKSLSAVKKQTGGDNIKFDVDFRTAYDYISYETASGKKYTNDALFSNRLWLGMGYTPVEGMIFRGQLSMNKAFGANPPADSSISGMPQRGYGFDSFDWVVNENLTDGSVRVREVYWLYKSASLFGSDVSWSTSIGRRPSTNGFLANFRDDDDAKSPLGHVINMEFDGGSFKLGFDKVTGIDGLSFKLCFGRGLTNANARFTQTGLDYAKDEGSLSDNVDLAGFIFVPYDDGQYSVKTTYYRGFNVPGVYANDFTAGPGGQPMPTSFGFASVGDMDGAAISVLANGLGDGWSDFTDEMILFGSFAWSQTNPDNKRLPSGGLPPQAGGAYDPGMLGSTDKESGTSFWLGAQIPVMFTDDGKFGLEYNHGSKYWRPFTYGEDTMAGSKIAVRGDAYEAYYTQPLLKSFSFQVRATYMDYEYTGSQGFFAQGGTPMTMDEATAMGMDPVEKATDIRAYLRYRY
ncbi:MAG: hypothetical protein B5M52_03200 [Helicobacteraceae bacterium 4484_230]|nr:MAG: hypothetical protein B5M52_03200 [Helicobacteraceae bacterium 4484_230]